MKFNQKTPFHSFLHVQLLSGWILGKVVDTTVQYESKIRQGGGTHHHGNPAIWGSLLSVILINFAWPVYNAVLEVVPYESKALYTRYPPGSAPASSDAVKNKVLHSVLYIINEITSWADSCGPQVCALPVFFLMFLSVLRSSSEVRRHQIQLCPKLTSLQSVAKLWGFVFSPQFPDSHVSAWI